MCGFVFLLILIACIVFVFNPLLAIFILLVAIVLGSVPV